MAECVLAWRRPGGGPIQISKTNKKACNGCRGGGERAIPRRWHGRPIRKMYVPHAQTNLRSITICSERVRWETPQVLAAAREVVRRFDARLPLIFPGAMAALVDEQLARPRFYQCCS